jgi:O-glycosyl hydrolase
MNVLETFLLKMILGLVRPTLLSSLEKMGKDLFICQIYIDDIIFGSTNKFFYDEFSKIMTDSFEMSMMGVLTFFLGFQIKQVKDRTFISQTKYTRGILKKFDMDQAKPIKTSTDTNGHLDLDLGDTSVD